MKIISVLLFKNLHPETFKLRYNENRKLTKLVYVMEV